MRKALIPILLLAAGGFAFYKFRGPSRDTANRIVVDETN